ncbi:MULTISPECIES: aldo/keto reductase [Robertmurraya]|uniref:Aldo/keto reductase n=1 Tax=Robertmurraya beringensis TaxID=641660 RepID=A0ABV6KNP6_9BACI
MVNKVGINDRKVFPIGIGTWKVGNRLADEAREIEALKVGLDAGAQVIDTAETYGDGLSETLVGKAIQGYKRDSLYLVSKVLPENASRRYLPISLENTLERLQVNYLDMYLLHWKSSIPLRETVEAMEEMRAAGKIKAWGVSNFDTADLKRLFTLPHGTNCLTNQVKYNLIYRGIEYDLIPYMKQQHMPLMAYSPVVKGKFGRFNLQQQNILEEVASNHQATIQQILIAWSIRDGNTISIPKSSNSAHMLENIKSAQINLTTDELGKIDTVFRKPTSKESLALW